MSEADVNPDKPAEAVMVASPMSKGPLRRAFSGWWGPGPAGGPQASSNELAEERTDMAATRSLMAADRTLMAWVRTALSMDSFGFTIYKVLHALGEAGGSLPRAHTPRNVGLFLTGLGTLSMVLGTVEYAQALRDLHTLKDISLMRPAFIVAILMSVLGLYLFFSIFVKVA